jgi:hypothetical protein
MGPGVTIGKLSVARVFALMYGARRVTVMPPDLQAALRSAAAYPPWLVILCAIIAGVFLFWLLGRVLAWSLEVVMALILILGVAVGVWLLLQ